MKLKEYTYYDFHEFQDWLKKEFAKEYSKEELKKLLEAVRDCLHEQCSGQDSMVSLFLENHLEDDDEERSEDERRLSEFVRKICARLDKEEVEIKYWW